MKTNKWLNVISLIIAMSLALAACANPTPTADAANTAVAETLEAQPTDTRVPTQTDVPTSSPEPTVIPDPGTEELKKVNKKILDGGPMQFFGNSMTDFGSKSDGTKHYTENAYELVFFRVVQVPHALLAGPNTEWSVGEGVRYFRYTVPQDVDLVLLIEEVQYILPEGAPFTRILYSLDVTVPNDDFLHVGFDYTHTIGMPAQTWHPAIATRQLATGDEFTFDGWMLISGVCEDSKTKSQFVVTLTFTAPCPMKATLENIYFINGDKDSPRKGSREEELKLMWYLMRLADTRAGETWHGVERYMQVVNTYLGWQPIDQFDALHQIMPTATNTLLPTATRTPDATYTPRPATATSTATP